MSWGGKTAKKDPAARLVTGVTGVKGVKNRTAVGQLSPGPHCLQDR